MALRCFCLQSIAAAAYFALAIVGVPTLGFSKTIDQQNVGQVIIHYADLNKGNDFELLQSFTASITGTLDQVSLPVYEDVISPPPYNEDLWYDSSATITVFNNKLAVLGSVVIPAASIPNIASSKALHDAFDLNARFKLFVTRGSLYFIAIQANRIVPIDYAGNGLSWFATVADYTNGGPYGSYQGSLFPFFYNSYDLEFRTYVTPTRGSVETSEPATWAMMLVGFAGLAYAGYRASRKRQLHNPRRHRSALRREQSILSSREHGGATSVSRRGVMNLPQARIRALAPAASKTTACGPTDVALGAGRGYKITKALILFAFRN